MDDDDDEEAPYYCISQLRCSLCRFGLQDGELIVAYVDQWRFSSKFPFQSNAIYYDDDILGIKFHMCGSVCPFRGRRVPCFHGHCFDFRLFPITPSFLAAFEYSTLPSLGEESRRFDRTWRLLVPRLPAHLTTRLPVELIVIIAKLLVRERAVVTAQEQVHGSNASDSRVSLHGNVYALFQVIDGVRYVQSLHNHKPGRRDVGARLLCVSEKIGTVRKIIIAEDHLGIRLIRFASSDVEVSLPAQTSGLWWRDILRHDGIAELEAKTDSLKLRDIVCDSEAGDKGFDSVRWATPNHPDEILDLVTLHRSRRFLNPLRMCYFDCNASGTTGYSVATDGVGIATIHTHRQGENFRFYQEINLNSKFRFWIHMSLDCGEFVTEICRTYSARHLQGHSVRLVFITNRGRSVLFGCYTPMRSGTQLERVHTLQQAESRIFFNAWDCIAEKEVRYMAFKGTSHVTSRPLPSELLTTQPYPGTQYNEPWFFSCCEMRGIAEIILCKDVTSSYRPVMGLQVRYRDGHRVCLGQFRFDMALETVLVDQSSCLHIGSRRTGKSYLYVAEVTSRQPDRGKLAWLDIGWDGKLEWWFSSRHTVVRLG